MEQKEIVAIFNEKLTKVYNEQEEKYKRKKEEEKDRLSVIFEGLLETRETLDSDAFINLIKREEE
ncbi:MAG: hypothetical protein ACTSRT_21105 [Promethearchaeota archaeon]